VRITSKLGRFAAIAATAGIVLFGASSALAGPAAPGDGPYTGANIVDGTLWQSDQAPSVNKAYLETYYNTVGDLQLKQEVRDLLHPLQADTLNAAVTDKNVGGSIFAASAATELGIENVTLKPGKTYLLAYSVQFERTVAAAAGDPVIRVQVSPWLNKNANDTFDAAEAVPGAVSANDELPPVTGRQGTASGSVVYTVPAGDPAVSVQLAGHAYADNASDTGEGQFQFTAATLSATLIG
jgi:hypothetical protein